MASSTPPHCSITAPSKPHQTPHHYPSHQTLHHHKNHRLTAHKVTASPLPNSLSTAKVPNFLSPLPSSQKTHLTPDFSGKKSTRFVSKLHFNRPRSNLSTRHSSLAEEVLKKLVGDDDCDGGGVEVVEILMGFQGKLCGSEDYCFLIRELGNRGECGKVVECYEFAVKREKKVGEKGKLASTMISVMGRFGNVELARFAFDNAVNQGYGNTVYTYSALISAYGRSGFYKEAIGVFDQMKTQGLKPNLVTYNAVIDACAKAGIKFGVVSAIYDEMLSIGVCPDRITFNSMLAVCKCGLWKEAMNLVAEMGIRGIDQDVFTYNTLLDVICKGGKMDLAFEIISEMTAKNVMPNVVTYSTVIDGFAKAGRLEDALGMFEEMKYVGIKSDRVCHNALLSIYLKLGRFKDALNVCKEMESAGIRKDVVTYNALLGGFGKQGKYGEVKQVFERMKAARVLPNVLTYSTLIDVYSKGGLYSEAMQVFREFKEAGLKADVVLYSGLIDALCKNGHVESAVLLLDEMTKEGIRPNVVTYNTIIDAFGRSAGVDCVIDSAVGVNGLSQGESSTMVACNAAASSLEGNKHGRVMKIFGQLAAQKSLGSRKFNDSRQELFWILGVFQKMHELEIKPNVVTFSAILNACRHFMMMGGCKVSPGACTNKSCRGYEVDLMHFSIGTAIPGRLYGGNLLDIGTGADRFGHLVDVYAWNPHCRYLDGHGPSDSNNTALNDWRGAWWHSSLDVHSGFVDEDSPYGSDGGKGTYYFEFSRPLRTTDRFQQDAQFKIGGTSKFSAAFWYPVDGNPWHGSGHYTVSCDWLPLDFIAGGGSLSATTTSPASSWDAAIAFSLLLSVVAFCLSVFMGYRVSTQNGVPFTPMDRL